MTMATPDRTLVVQQSFPTPRPTTNPYLVQLGRHLGETEGLEVRNFGWRSALRADYDIFHVHWPENLAKGNSPLKSLGRRFFTRLLLFRLRMKQIPIVRTLHNVDRPEGRSRAEYRILDRIDDQTALVIRLNSSTMVDEGLPVETIVHGHYRDWFQPYRQSIAIRSRLGFFGLVRRYKNVVALVNVHAALPEEFTLRIAGQPSNEDLVREIELARKGNERVALDFHFLTDAELVEVVTQSELVVLPYTDMHNSGSVLASLSLARPVLVRDNPVNRALSQEVGAGWVHLYAGELTPQAVLDAQARIDSSPGRPAPNLNDREWDRVGVRHLTAYRRALQTIAS